MGSSHGRPLPSWTELSSHIPGDSPFTRAMFSPRPTLSLTLLMSLAGGQSPRVACLLRSPSHGRRPLQAQLLTPHSIPDPIPSTPRSLHLVLEADLGSNDIGSPADHAEGQVLFRTWLGQATFVLLGPWLWAGTERVTHGPGPGVTQGLRGEVRTSP